MNSHQLALTARGKAAHRIKILLAAVLLPVTVFCQQGYYSRFAKDTLTIGNGLIERKFRWNNGNLITCSLADIPAGKYWFSKSESPDFFLTKNSPDASNAACSSREVAETEIQPAYLETTVSFSLGPLEVKRVFRIFKNSPAIACDTYLKGRLSGGISGHTPASADRKNIEFTEDMTSGQEMPVLDQFRPGGMHWQGKTVEFFDVTDWNNNLVSENRFIPYRKTGHKGNLLFAADPEKEAGFFFLKEAPGAGSQLAYSGQDFTTEFGHFAVNGLGLASNDLREKEWRKTYTCVVGVYAGTELDQLTALRSYQKNIRKLLPRRDEMVMMNTWGDRSQDTKVNAQFCLSELERAAKLGITHFQIDDGWQSGKSPNSALAKGSFKRIWDNPGYWEPDPLKYPQGLQPVVRRGKELGIEICLWFNPSVENDYADWEKDVQALVKLYQEYGIRTFKIDGLSIPDKQAEINLLKLFDKVLLLTKNNVVFNLDVTAGRRGGYHMLSGYGNIFLENRYTDWQNYYPYWTLRNLWQLSKYVPAEKLQLEFLNKWRNAAGYGSDVFAPANYSFEYLFASTMAAQPLAWFEAGGLPEEGLKAGKLIESYKTVQHDLHSGVILPVGEEPSGKSWTGFQSVNQQRGYFIFFRERNSNRTGIIETWLPAQVKVKCSPVLGNGKAMTQITGHKGSLKVELPGINDFVLYKYEILK